MPERWLPAGLGPNAKLNKMMLGSFSYGPLHHKLPVLR